ncbi:MAG TPA: cytochrome c oxidase accessory protein CcoG [Steroidobacteraceae bacterium]|nr:cytochrome c oxidase accessory protein CcoG [Steroidobacteraceae bacterium]
MSEVEAQVEGGLYAARQKIYPREIQGRFQSLRVYAVWALLGLYYVLPWIRWEGRQAVLFDLPARKFHIFALTFWPQDFYLLTWLLVIAALSLFFFTALGGRLFCGYACPQTVWTEVFLWMERWVEGSRTQQMKLARAPWTRDKILRVGAKQFLWITFALWTGFTFVGYFTPVLELAGKIASFATGPWETFWVLFYGGATYVNAGYMREQVCKYMCPYARFQSAMFDDDTLVITYDERRGEPRGARKRGSDHKAKGLGDCVDCTMCVQVCPTGIDIRKGLQYECIACAACIDACDDVMAKVGYPKGLIRYDTQHGLEGKPKRILRTRTIVYGTLLAVLVVGFFVAIAHRNVVGVDVIRDRNALFRERPDGTIENVYNVKILNKDGEPHAFVITATGLPGLQLDYGTRAVDVAPGEVRSVPVRIRVPRHELRGGADITVSIHTEGARALEATGKARFLAPTN